MFVLISSKATKKGSLSQLERKSMKQKNQENWSVHLLDSGMGGSAITCESEDL